MEPGDAMKYQHTKHTDAYEVTQTSNSDVFYKTKSLKTLSVFFLFMNIDNLENSGLEVAPAVHAPGAVAAVSQCCMQGPCENSLQSPAVAASTALRQHGNLAFCSYSDPLLCDPNTFLLPSWVLVPA